MKRLLLIFFIAPLLAEEPITRVAAGSCYNPKRDTLGVWKALAKEKPQLFLFMGDNIYGDTKDMEVLKAKWNVLTSRPDYIAFNKNTPILATWDDHDYGLNDAGKEYSKRKESQAIFRDVFGLPHTDVEGVYHSKITGPEGKRLQVILLDTRYHRTTPKRGLVGGRNGYVPQTDPMATILGEEQWRWFAAELKKPAELRLIVSSIQVISNEHRFEKWENFPNERKRFLNLLNETSPGPTILLSGDRHLAEICKIPKAETGLPFDLYDFTTSGMSHAGSNDSGCNYRVDGSYSKKENFGLLDIDWSSQKPAVSMHVKSVKSGETTHTTRVDFSK